ncbi:MAG: signal peptide peptidase SppA [Alistipes sp.]|jgi:protease-4|nr:signal peptide peptidase SppA [Alistipes sp.]
MNFGRTFFASLLAVIVGFGLVVMLWTMVVVGMVASFGSSPSVVVARGSVLQLDLGAMTDSPAVSPLDGFDFQRMEVVPRMTLLKTLQAVQAAAADDRIEGIYIRLGESASASLASLEEVRAELERFKESGKFVVAYQEAYSQLAYWFASVADEVYTNPAGGMEWKGLSSTLIFYKGLFDKLGVEPVVIRHGSFKSAVEPYILDRMSPENRLQYEKMTGALWGMVLEQVSASRDIPVADLQAFADGLTIDSPAAAVANGLIDDLRYEDQVTDRLAELAGTAEGEEPGIVSLGDYATQVSAPNPSAKNKIAVIYAEGTIVSGSGARGEVGSDPMVEKIRRAREDEDAVAVVLRINSPGGSALASEVMWRELELLKAEKPLIVSMGALAASGGYYIAAPADAIYANRATLTGSIGVFGLFYNVGGALKDKLGVTTDVVNTGRYADLGSAYRSPSSAELAYIQTSVEDVYTTFVGHVAEGRNMTPEAVDNIGQGRVWAGDDALEIGLIDGFGGLAEAVSLAADRVGVSGDFRIWEVTAEPSPLDALLGGLSASIRTRIMKDELGPLYNQYQNIRNVLNEGGIQARMPFAVDIQ